jgi:lipopolysaccharide export system permease protein
MPWILWRYLLKEIIPSFLIGLVVFTMVLLMDKIMRIVDWIVQKGVPAGEVVKMFGCLLPNFFVLTLPTALLLAVLLSFSRIYGDNELYALKTAGISLYRLFSPVVFFGTLVTATALALTTWAGPRATRNFESLFYSVASQNLFFGLKERVFFDTLPGYVIYIEHVEPERQRLEGVFIANSNFPEGPAYYVAREGSVSGDLEQGKVDLTLKNGSLHHRVAGRDAYQVAEFDSLRIRIDLGYLLSSAKDRGHSIEELTLPELGAEIRSRAGRGEKVARLQLNYHQRLALPFGALVFCMLGIPLSLLSQRAVRYTGFSLSIVVILLYYVLLQAGTGLVLADGVPAALGAWLPNLLLGALGFYLLRRTAEEKSLGILERYAETIQNLQEAIRRRLRSS